MGSWLDTVEQGEVATRPLKIVCYGVEGVGKSTWAMGAPEPVYFDGEDGTLALDVRRKRIHSWPDFLNGLRALVNEQHPFLTLVLDTLDSLERMLAIHICQNRDARSIEDVGGGYGKGWIAVAEEWGKAIGLLEKLQEKRGMHVVALAHADAAKFADPDGADYNRWSLRLNKRSAAIWKGWTDELLFATRDVTSTKRDKGKGKGGARVLYTEWAPGREAKNRHFLPARLELTWNAFAHALRDNVGKAERQRAEREARQPQDPQREHEQERDGEANSTEGEDEPHHDQRESGQTGDVGEPDHHEPDLHEEPAPQLSDEHRAAIAESEGLIVRLAELRLDEFKAKSAQYLEGNSNKFQAVMDLIARQKTVIENEELRLAQLADQPEEDQAGHDPTAGVDDLPF